MVSGDTHVIFGGYMGTSTLVLRVQFRRSSGNYQVRASLLNDGSTWTDSSWFTISDAYHQIKFDWRAATAAGANNGGLTLWIDGGQVADLTAVDNDTRRIDRARLGAVNGIDSGTRGTYYFDEFESSRGSGGPPLPTADFFADPTSGTAPLAVSFTNTSQPTASITGYLWDFGDGNTSTETNPVHTYTAVGDYTVTLTAFAGSEQDSEIKTNYIHVISSNVSVVGAFTADGNWNPKTTFVPGDPIQWVLEVQNDTGQDAQIELTYDVRGPNGEQVTYWNGVVTTSPGLTWWGLPGTVESGLDGTHTLYGSGLYQGNLSQASSTYIVSSDDLIFADGFESCDLSAWPSSTTDGGDLSAGPPGLVGACSLRAVIDDNVSIYVTSNHPNAESRYRARFYFNPNSISMASGDLHTILLGRTGSGASVFTVQLNNNTGTNTGYRIRTQIFNDAGSSTNGTYFGITNATHYIEIDWQAATAAGANNGYITLWIDGVQKYTSPGIDNDARRVEEVRLGAVAGIDAGTRGTYYFDAFESRRQNYIGP
jgi:PKD repeat protein